MSLRVVLLAIVVAAVALALILFVMTRVRKAGADQADADDPDQVDVIVVGAPSHTAGPAHSGDTVSPVHPTIIVHLPRLGNQVGFLPNTPAGHLLYDWLAAFNHGSYGELVRALPSAVPGSTAAAQLQLRRETGGFSLLSAKEVEPGMVIFRLRDQAPAANDFIGALQVDPGSHPVTVATFSLHAVPAPAQKMTAKPLPATSAPSQ